MFQIRFVRHGKWFRAGQDVLALCDDHRGQTGVIPSHTLKSRRAQVTPIRGPNQAIDVSDFGHESTASW
jgi:hypothetical protein